MKTQSPAKHPADMSALEYARHELGTPLVVLLGIIVAAFAAGFVEMAACILGTLSTL